MAEDYMTNPNAQNELFKPVDVEKPNYIKVIGVGGGGGNADGGRYTRRRFRTLQH